jgi:aspartyl-tRNA synthetase
MMRSHYCVEITPSLAGKQVRLAGWVHEIRDFGAVKFILLRDRSGITQLTIKKEGADAALIETAESLVKETAITASGVVASKTIAKVGREVLASKIEVVGRVLKQVPFEVTGKVPAEIDVRLDHRSIDLRRIETRATFKIRAEAQRAFRQAMLDLGCEEITPPCIVAESTEGGTNLFSLKYFEREAFLAQSPQLYKQLAVLGGFDRVFMTTPVFRAEKHNTTVHLNESTQMDCELGFADDEDALSFLEKTILGILAAVKKNCAAELALLKSDFAVPKRVPAFTYDEVLERLAKKKIAMGWGEDFSKEVEQKLESVLGAELFFITRWPTKIRAFYSMPLPENPKICKAYDLCFKGLEIASGAQRIHDPALLEKQLRFHDLNPKDFEPYVDAFRYGSVPHAGWSIGLERLAMKLAARENIREAALFPRDRQRLTP